MPTQPPIFGRPAGKRKAWESSSHKSPEARGYGRAHRQMRKLVLVEEPLCRLCLADGVSTPSTIADHIIPKADGGGSDRGNYQGLCKACHDRKTIAERRRRE